MSSFGTWRASSLLGLTACLTPSAQGRHDEKRERQHVPHKEQGISRGVAVQVSESGNFQHDDPCKMFDISGWSHSIVAVLQLRE